MPKKKIKIIATQKYFVGKYKGHKIIGPTKSDVLNCFKSFILHRKITTQKSSTPAEKLTLD